jgi:ABC-type transporter Mla maintaining outer membrane lipid asymmetry permease subunit MlaE
MSTLTLLALLVAALAGAAGAAFALRRGRERAREELKAL